MKKVKIQNVLSVVCERVSTSNCRMLDRKQKEGWYVSILEEKIKGETSTHEISESTDLIPLTLPIASLLNLKKKKEDLLYKNLAQYLLQKQKAG